MWKLICMSPCHVIEAIDPFKWALTSISNTYNVIHNLHLLWMCIYMSRYHCSCQPSTSNFPRILVTSQEGGKSQHIVIVHWFLRLYTHSSGPPHQYQTHKRRFKTFICCGCACVWVLATLLLLLSTNLLDVSLNSCNTSRGANHNVVHWFRL